MAKLGGTMFIIDGMELDYCFKESILSMQEHCDEVVIVDAGSKDGTQDVLKTLENNFTKIIYLDRSEWDSLHGWHKLNYFSNKAIAELTTEWNWYQQGDEILHESCYDTLRIAINSGEAEGYFSHRLNLWASPYKMLNVVGNRNPCSTQVLRLAKSKYMTYGDAESIACEFASDRYVRDIRLYHMGFVRKRDIHPEKIRRMQQDIFEVPVDEKLKGMDVFRPDAWFNENELIDIPEQLPILIQEWAKERYYDIS